MSQAGDGKVPLSFYGSVSWFCVPSLKKFGVSLFSNRACSGFPLGFLRARLWRELCFWCCGVAFGPFIGDSLWAEAIFF